jgi:hypothetical protein
MAVPNGTARRDAEMRREGIECVLRLAENQGTIYKDAGFGEIVVQYGRNSPPFSTNCPARPILTCGLTEIR